MVFSGLGALHMHVCLRSWLGPGPCRQHGPLPLERSLLLWLLQHVHPDTALAGSWARADLPYASATNAEHVTGLVVASREVVVMTGGSLLQVHYQNRLLAFDGRAMLIQGNRLEAPKITLRLCADSLEGRFWIGFNFLTEACSMQATPQPVSCSTMELVQVSKEGSCAVMQAPCYWVDQSLCSSVPICVVLVVTGIWGNTIQAGFSGVILDMAMDMPSNILYLLLQGGVYAYHVYYYAPGTLYKDRFDDTLQYVTGSNGATALAVVGGTLFMPGFSHGPASSHFVPPLGTRSLYPIGDHLLGVDGTTQAPPQS